MTKRHDIQLAPTDLCTGCSACVSVCKHDALSMVIDRQGFLSPKRNAQLCTGCHLCEKVCPVINASKKEDVIAYAYNAQTNDREALAKSSSGGAFYELSRYIINNGGVVFGVRFNGIHVEHGYAETLKEVEAFMGSKYVQSEVGYTYREAKNFLDQDRWVLYTGTPCQIAGLKRFLGKEYAKLLTVDVICHGVPSPGIWERYITRLMKKLNTGDVKDVRFRIKGKEQKQYYNFYFFFFFLRDNQWHTYGESRTDNLFYAYFTRHLFRSSCYDCPYRDINAPDADITIGDAVTTEQFSEQIEMPSTMIVRTVKGEAAVKCIKDYFDVFEPLQLEAVNAYYEREKALIQQEKSSRQWMISNRLGMILPLEYIKFVWKYDKTHVIIKRKFKKLCKKITK